jgi:anti-sigma regulatory factor (Ser/Thr protein kinase)
VEHLGTTVRHDHEADVTVITVTGELTMNSARQLWTAMAKRLADCPVGVVVDIRLLHQVDPLALTIFRAAARAHRGIMPGVPVLVCADGSLLGNLTARTALGTDVPIVATATDGIARAVASTRSARPFMADLPYSAEAAPVARDVVAEACAAWDLDAGALRADIIASELATNAYRHARSASRLEVRRQGPYIIVAVTDRNPDRPVSPPAAPDPHAGHGRGMWIVALYSSSWGVRERPDGKTVWAAIRVTPVRLDDVAASTDDPVSARSGA